MISTQLTVHMVFGGRLVLVGRLKLTTTRFLDFPLIDWNRCPSHMQCSGKALLGADAKRAQSQTVGKDHWSQG